MLARQVTHHYELTHFPKPEEGISVCVLQNVKHEGKGWWDVIVKSYK